MNSVKLKEEVRDFWNTSSCGEIYASGEEARKFYETHAAARFQLEPYIHDFARFSEGSNKDILEIGIGMGADHLEWAKASPKSLTGIDLTPRAVEHTKSRLELYNLSSRLSTEDAENLPFDKNQFDLVYSWGVIHHSPNTSKAIKEIHRVLKKGGTTRIMIYHTYSLTGYMLWMRYALLTLKPFTSLNHIYWNHLESTGTKAYTVKEARQMFSDFENIDIKIKLSFGDLLEGEVGQKHKGFLLSTMKKVWPRKLLKSFAKNHGLMLLIEAKK